LGLRSSVDLAPVAHLDHKDTQAIIVDLIDCAIVANADPPLKTSLQLACTRWPRLIGKSFGRLDYALRGLSIESLERFPCSASVSQWCS
jgi:hypothetical protein